MGRTFPQKCLMASGSVRASHALLCVSYLCGAAVTEINARIGSKTRVRRTDILNHAHISTPTLRRLQYCTSHRREKHLQAALVMRISSCVCHKILVPKYPSWRVLVDLLPGKNGNDDDACQVLRVPALAGHWPHRLPPRRRVISRPVASLNTLGC